MTCGVKNANFDDSKRGKPCYKFYTVSFKMNQQFWYPL